MDGRRGDDTAAKEYSPLRCQCGRCAPHARYRAAPENTRLTLGFVAMPAIPAQYLLSGQSPPPRTLIDVLYETGARYPDAPAIDDGDVQLTYSEVIADIEAGTAWLASRGVGQGDRVGIRMPSGSYSLYLAILTVLAAGAAYVPVDADDPDERAELVFGEAGVVGVVTEDGLIDGSGPSRGRPATRPQVTDDAWISFTSGPTGTPKAVSLRGRRGAAG